jgi:amino acid adenylation domain-containing protein
MSNTNHRGNNNFSLAEKRQLLADLLHQKTASLKTYPTSFAQQRLWFLHQLEPDSPAYHLPCVIQLTGALSISALTQALNEIVRRHEVLRTTFVMSKGQPIQVVVPTVTLTIPQIDLHQIPASKRDSEVLRLANEEARRSFDLVKAPLLRVTLLSFAELDHVVLFTMHHIVSDAWSMQLLVQELTTLYTAFSSGKQSSLTELPIQYADFAVWQRQQLQGGILETQLEYWLNQLSGELPNLHLPTDRPRPIAQSSRGATHSFALSDELTQQLESLSQRENVTLFMTLLAAFNTLLYRYTGQSDILIGSPIANRNRPEIERLIGFFVNTLVFRTHIAADQTFQELLHQVCEVALGAYANQDLPFELLVEKLQPQRTLSYKPLFQVMFVLQNAPERSMILPGVTLHSQFSHTDTAKFDLTLSMSKREGGLTGQIEYSTDLFEPATIARMVSHLQNLLHAIVYNPQQRLSELPLLTEPEQHHVLTEWNDTRTDYSLDRSIHQLIETQVEYTPDSIAVTFDNQQISYQELNHRANQLAHYLRSLGMKPETLVGICLERSLDMVIAILAVLKAGAAYVPLDPSYPPERLSFMLHDAQVPVLLTQQRLIPTLPEHLAQLICLDSIWDAIAQQPHTDLECDVSTSNLAYVIYTSGSTGQPKGAMNTHQGLTNRLYWMQQRYQLTSDDRVLQKTPFSFDVSVWEFLWPVMVGARLVVARPEGHQDSHYLTQLIVEQGITTLHFVPSMLQVFLEEPAVKDCCSLTRVICSGEALPLKLQQRYFERLQAPLYNLYGPTEAAIDVTAWDCFTAWDYQPKGDRPTVPIGYPIANTQIYLLDAFGQPVPIGVPGELHIGGVQVARGYWQRPDLTAERFIPNPFGQNRGDRLYKTGDLARYLPDGSIEFLGRLDHQVKLRGLRVELGEIEAAFHQHPAIREVVVTVHEQEEHQSLVAYVVPVRSAEPNSFQPPLRAFLQTKLPAYIVPSVFIFLDALPLTPNGKVNRQALPQPDPGRSPLEETFVAPRTPTEIELAQIWSQVLKVELIGIHDHFFDLGGHSLLATQAISRIREALQIDIPLRSLFEKPTIAELAQHIETRRMVLQQWQSPTPVATTGRKEIEL